MDMQDQLVVNNKKRPPLLVVAGICFSTTAILYFAVQLLAYFGLLPEAFYTNVPLNLSVSQLGFILLPTLIILLVSGYNLREVLRLNRPKLSEILISAAFPIILLPAMLGFAMIALLTIGLLFGSTNLSGVESLTSMSLGLLILFAAVLPALCEEVLFRGALLKGLQKHGIVLGIIISSFLFGLFHMDPQRFIAQALLGAVAATVVYRTNSIFCGMTVHFSHNAFSFLLSELLSATGAADDASQSTDIMVVIREQAELIQMDPTILCIIMIGTMMVVTVFFLALSLPLFFALFKVTKNKVRELPDERQLTKPVYYVAMVPGLLIIIAFYAIMIAILIGG